MVIFPDVRLSEGLLDIAFHLRLLHHVDIVLSELTLKWLSIEVAGVIDEAVCAVVGRSHVLAEFALLHLNYALGFTFFFHFLALLLIVKAFKAICRRLSRLLAIQGRRVSRVPYERWSLAHFCAAQPRHEAVLDQTALRVAHQDGLVFDRGQAWMKRLFEGHLADGASLVHVLLI